MNVNSDVSRTRDCREDESESPRPEDEIAPAPTVEHGSENTTENHKTITNVTKGQIPDLIPISPSPPTLSAKAVKLQHRISTLQSSIQATQASLATSISTLTSSSDFPPPTPDASPQNIEKHAIAQAQTISNKHISTLKRYNEIKDIALGLLGLIAEKEGRRLADLVEERGVSDKD